MKVKKLILIILDGWGIGNRSKADAIFNAKTPEMDRLLKSYPHAQLRTSGLDVGLPEGQMGNSEVGHLNIGAGRIVYQELTRISKDIEDGHFSENKVLNELFQYCLNNNKPLHLIGLLSDGGVHSHEKHVYEISRLAELAGLKQIYIHAFLDGRDTDPKSGIDSIKRLQHVLKNKTTKLVSLIGRYYAMDRDQRWERVKKAYDLLCSGIGEKSIDLSASLLTSYQNNITDEFLEPVYLNDGGNYTIKPNDAVFCFNFRTDRCREITKALTQLDFPEFSMKTLPLHYVTMTNYDDTFKNVRIVFEKDDLKNTLGEVLEKHHKTQLRAAETEKYPHVTFFFSGGREKTFEGEHRIMVNSPKVATYDLKPEMSAPELTQNAIQNIKTQKPDFVCLNYANADMVGHTGVYSAITKAVETVDLCLKQLLETCLEEHYTAIVIADHGNADMAINPDGSPNTAHSTNPVPLVLVNSDRKTINSGILADVAPTILTLLDIPVPPEMTGKILV